MAGGWEKGDDGAECGGAAPEGGRSGRGGEGLCNVTGHAVRTTGTGVYGQWEVSHLLQQPQLGPPPPNPGLKVRKRRLKRLMRGTGEGEERDDKDSA